MISIAMIVTVIIMFIQWYNYLPYSGTLGILLILISTYYRSGAWKRMNSIKWDKVLYYALNVIGLAAVIYYICSPIGNRIFVPLG